MLDIVNFIAYLRTVESRMKQFAYDIDTIYRDLKDRETKTGRKYFSLPSKRIEPVK